MCRNASKLYRAVTVSLAIFMSTPSKAAGNVTWGHVHHSIRFLWCPLMNFQTGEFRSKPGQVLTGAIQCFLSPKEICPEETWALSQGSCRSLKALAKSVSTLVFHRRSILPWNGIQTLTKKCLDYPHPWVILKYYSSQEGKWEYVQRGSAWSFEENLSLLFSFNLWWWILILISCF